MAHFGFIGQGKQILINLVFGQCRDRKRCNKFCPALGQDGADIYTAITQPTDHLKHLIGGNAARDDQQDSFSI